MERIDTSGWKVFEIGSIFDVVKGTRLTKANMRKGNIKFVGSSAMNNGETARISNDNHLHPSNTITVCYNGSVGETFYQDEEFWASDDVNVLYPKFDMNQFIALFICPIIKNVGQKYAFIDKWKQEDMKGTNIFLPATTEGKPDFAYMDAYMRKIVKESEASLEDLRRANKSKTAIETGEWQEFWLRDLFDFKLPQGDLQVKKVEDGDIPLITPSAFNNGLLQRISSESKSTLFPANTLTVDMFGNAYYQEENYFVTAHGHVNVLLPKIELNKNSGMFIATAIRSMFLKKYGFSEMCTQKVLKGEKVRLPILKDGSPDMAYMEEYMSEMLDTTSAGLGVLAGV